jgi:hypothetical protein
MRDRYIAVPIGVLHGLAEHATFEEAAAQGAIAVQTDKTPRLVLHVQGEVRLVTQPVVQTARFSEETPDVDA